MADEWCEREINYTNEYKTLEWVYNSAHESKMIRFYGFTCRHCVSTVFIESSKISSKYSIQTLMSKVCTPNGKSTIAHMLIGWYSWFVFFSSAFTFKINSPNTATRYDIIVNKQTCNNACLRSSHLFFLFCVDFNLEQWILSVIYFIIWMCSFFAVDSFEPKVDRIYWTDEKMCRYA